MAWVALISAGLCEVLGVLSIKRVTEYRSWGSYLFLIIAFGMSFSLLTFSMTQISMGTAYAVWTGIGTAGSTILGMLVFGEQKEWRRVLFIGLILVSAAGLKLIS
ncbi:DMT family transporter [Paenibacillus radicis (ex Xue et al. 2023)]|uniref:Multidrug efflux SMR transporter n=1 Tax=Paenibacillus radicis (ex Xue et al. 2023) TaxID=2972489 RepID=A0ABT1YQX1_9BACL|nr:multidrug efflux SMR transporter [Paenibacillus radicis (ex Xue et al. 2023)]MCR8635582.1 multidrug efflux SMR transporter [Paenibacillus radicis (ex Xue et al. 2023)]